MEYPAIVTQAEWLDKRKALLEQEKAFTRERDKLAATRRELPMVQVDQDYRFQSTGGEKSLADLFGPHSQLIVQHFMFGRDWEEGCPSCSFWSDTYDGLPVHLAARDVTFLCCSRAPLDHIAAYRARMGWTFDWVSSAGSDFNFDFGVSFTEDQRREGGEHNYRHTVGVGEEMPGLSAFVLNEGQVYHTYSTYERGLDPLNGAYQLLDLAPFGRDEADLEWPMAWLRRHDSYS